MANISLLSSAAAPSMVSAVSTVADSARIELLKKQIGGANYYYAAYAVVWIVLFVYLFTISRHERELRREVSRLSHLVSQSSGRGGGPGKRDG
jgi:CcmD family protein